MYVAAWPMWVASYGVIPQTYIRAGPSGSAGRTDPAAVSWTRTGCAVPRSILGTSGLVHARMPEA
jgi:hypothetical protein